MRVAIARVTHKGSVGPSEGERHNLPGVREAGEGERLVRGVYGRQIVAGENCIGVEIGRASCRERV